MNVKTTCPENPHLERFLQGQASTLEAASVQAHIESCEVCRATVAKLMADASNQNTLGDESCVGGAPSDHTCQIDAPAAKSALISAAPEDATCAIPPAINGAAAVNSDHTCQIEPQSADSAPSSGEGDDANQSAIARPRQDAGGNVSLENARADAKIDQTCELVTPAVDSSTLAEALDGGNAASVWMPDGGWGVDSPAKPNNDPTCQLAVPLQDSGTISDGADFSLAPGAPNAKGDPTCFLPGTAPGGGSKAPIDPTQTLDLAPAGNDDQTGSLEPGAAGIRLVAKAGAPVIERTLEGVVVPGYDVLKELGRGGMGVVYKARHRRLGRLVALKMVLAGAHLGKAGLARFRAEAEAIAQLQHSNIVQIYETGEHDGHPYFSLEYVDGGSLDQRIRESPTHPRVAAQLVETLARTMDVAHQRGIVHRDLKPANILLGALSGQSSVVRKEQLPNTTLPADHWSRITVPKIADFGLAKRVDDESGQTQTGTILGTPSYMAPEQAGGKTREIGPPADIYALGAILYEMLTGRPPFRAGNPIDTIRQVIEQEPVPPRQLEPRTPHDLETICLKCLEKEPSRRYATAADLADELRRFLDGEPITARPTPAWERAWKWGKRRPAIVALMGVSVLAVVGVVLSIVWHNVSLRSQLAAALAEELEAKQREDNALKEVRRSELRSEAQKLYDSARIAVGKGDLASAHVDLTKALAKIGNEAQLDAIKDPALDLLQQVKEKLRVDAERVASQDRFKEFANLRDKAQFLGTMYTGMDLEANLNAARSTCLEALAIYRVSIDQDTSPKFDDHLIDSQKAEIRGDCYQLLLILAETEAMSASDQKGPAKELHLRAALRFLDRALAFRQPSRAYHERRARYLNQLDDKAGAAQAEKAARGAAVVDVFDHFLMADEFYRRAKYDEAISEFEVVLQRQPNHFWAQYLNGLCLMKLKRYPEARAHLSAGIAQGKEFVWLYLLRGLAQAEMKAWDAAEDDFRKALTLKLDDYSRYVLLVNRGVLRQGQDRSEDAIADLKEAIKLKPKETAAFVNMANAYRQLKKFDLAVKQIDCALAIEPKNAHFYRLRARLHVKLTAPALALKDYDQAIKYEHPASPFHAGDHVERGRLLLRERKHAEALASFDAALRLQKDHSLGQRLRAEALFHLRRYPEVIEAFDRYLKAGGKPLESVYRGRGLALAELGKYPGAIDDFTKALDLQPTSAVQAYRGWMHLVVDAPKLAQRDFELALELDDKNGDAYNGRGSVRVTLGQYADAVKDAEAAVFHGPPSARLFYNAARIHAQCPGGEQRALELIVQSLAALSVQERPAFWSKVVQTDRALDAIRRYPRFVQLESTLLPRK